MVDAFKTGMGKGFSGISGLASGGKPADASAIARLGTPRAANLPGAAEPAAAQSPVPVAASMPAAVEATARNMPGVETRGLVRELAAAPPVDAGRVAELKAQIAAGTYRPDAERIASAMLASEGVSRPES